MGFSNTSSPDSFTFTRFKATKVDGICFLYFKLPFSSKLLPPILPKVLECAFIKGNLLSSSRLHNKPPSYSRSKRNTIHAAHLSSAREQSRFSPFATKGNHLKKRKRKGKTCVDSKDMTKE